MAVPRIAKFDAAAWVRLRAVFPEDAQVRVLFTDFMASSARLDSMLHVAALRGDAGSAYLAAHTLKAMAALVGARELRDASARLEAATGHGTRAADPRAVRCVRAEIAKAHSALRRWQARTA